MDYLLRNTDLRSINETLEEIFLDINNYKLLNKMRVLEVGVGNGNCTIPIYKKFKSYYGIEPLKYIYDVFIEQKKKHNCNIKSYNMDLQQFASSTNKKFDMIILRNVIHFIGYDDLIKECKKIVKKDAYIIIQNAQAIPYGWGNKEFVKDTIDFNEVKWLKFKNKLEICYDSLLSSVYLDKFKEDNKYNFFVLKTNNSFN